MDWQIGSASPIMFKETGNIPFHRLMGFIAMDLLLTWSGTPSHDIASFFRDWLPQVVPGIQPWISSQDIAKGKKWFEELTAQMSKTNISITFITPGNVRSPWVFYEIGFIAAKMENGIVCPYLIGVDGDLVKDSPIGQLQWTNSNKDDTLLLIQSINKELGGKGHNPQLIEGNFNSQWPRLKRALEKVVATSPPVIAEVTETEPSIEEQLSAEARQLLIEAAKDQHGQIMYVVTSAGTTIQTNRKNMISEQTPRCIAIWKDAIAELVDSRLAEAVGYEGHIFRVTRLGYEIADLITSRAS